MLSILKYHRIFPASNLCSFAGMFGEGVYPKIGDTLHSISRISNLDGRHIFTGHLIIENPVVCNLIGKYYFFVYIPMVFGQDKTRAHKRIRRNQELGIRYLLCFDEKIEKNLQKPPNMYKVHHHLTKKTMAR